ncbi:MAG TPA: hypothetical protein VNO33_01850, partial [Kofleriaceae bacterium]|nr:hypothetical protein [Kofleriaceae bacterium]
MKLGPPVAAALLCAGLAACRGEKPPDLRQIRERAYAELDRENLDAASELAEHGYHSAVKSGDRAAAWSLQVLRAEVLILRRDSDGALRLLTEPAPPGVALDVRARGLMTQGFALCQLVARGEVGNKDPAEELLARAEQIARSVGSARLTAEVALRRGTCDLQRGANEQAETRFRQGLSAARTGGLRRLEGHAAGS